MQIEERSHLLGRTPLFAGVDQASLVRLAEQTIVRTYRKGQFIFTQGDPGGTLVVVAGGLVKLAAVSELGTELIVDVVEPPGSFGEITLIDGGSRTTSAEALEPVRVLVLTRDALFEAVAVNATLSRALLLRLAQRLRATHESNADLIFRDLAGRVAKFLVASTGYPTQAGSTLDLRKLRLTQRDLAGLVGGSRQSVNQVLRGFETRGWIQMCRGTITLLQPVRLRDRASL